MTLKINLTLLFCCLTACSTSQVNAVSETCPTEFEVSQSVKSFQALLKEGGFAKWTPTSSHVDTADCASPFSTLVVNARSPVELSSTATPYESTFRLEVTRAGGKPASAERDKKRLLDKLNLIQTTIRAAEKDAEIGKWLEKHPKAQAQLRLSNDAIKLCAFYWDARDSSQSTTWCP